MGEILHEKMIRLVTLKSALSLAVVGLPSEAASCGIDIYDLRLRKLGLHQEQ